MSGSPGSKYRPLPADEWTEASNGGLHHLLGLGWSGPEPWGVWGIGPVHEFFLPVADIPTGDIALEADVHAALLGPRVSQLVDVLVAGQRLATWSFSLEANGGSRNVRIPAALVSRAVSADGVSVVAIEFRPRSSSPPVELDTTVSESRPLGLALHRARWRVAGPVQGNTPAGFGTKVGGRKMRTAVVTFVYNEAVNLPIWRRYYASALGERQLFVIDHGSNDGSTDDLGEISKLRLAREELDEHKRCVFMAGFQRSLLEYFDIVIYTDCDEIIVPDPDKYGGLADYLDRAQFDYIAPVGLNLQHMINLELPLDLQAPILRQRSFASFASGVSKPLISKVPLTWETGFHSCDKPVNVDRDLFLFHLKRMDYGIAFQRHKLTKEMRWAESSLVAKHGLHARVDFPRFVQESFFDPIAAMNAQGELSFEFDKEIAQMIDGMDLREGIFHIPHFAGRIVRIPDRFQHIF